MKSFEQKVWSSLHGVSTHVFGLLFILLCSNLLEALTGSFKETFLEERGKKARGPETNLFLRR